MPTILAILLDLVAVGLLSVIGRASHAESLDAAAVARTAAPFVVGALMGWVLLLVRHFTDSLWVQGLTVWIVTVVFGVFFRGVLGEGVPPVFVLVAATFLAAVMFGWRGVAQLLLRGRAIH